MRSRRLAAGARMRRMRTQESAVSELLCDKFASVDGVAR